MEKRQITDADKPHLIIKNIQPAKFNYGTVPAGTKIDFRFRLMADAPLALGFAPGCGCQADVSLTDPDENGIQVLSGKMETKSADKMAKGMVVENYEQYIDVFFNNPPYFEIVDQDTKEGKVANNLKSVRLFINGSVEKGS